MSPAGTTPGTVPHSALSYFAAEAAETARLAAKICRAPVAFARVDVESGTPLLGLIGLDPDDVETLAALSGVARRLASGGGPAGPIPLGLRYLVAAPISAAGGQVIGFLLAGDFEAREVDPTDEATLKTLARRLAESLELRQQARDLRAAEAALGRAQANFATLVEGLDSGLLLEDDERRVVVVNGALVRRFAPLIDRVAIIGLPAVELFAKLAIRFSQPEDFVALADPERRSMKRQLGQTFETTDGRTFEIDSLPVRGSEGAGHIYQFRDVSERVRNLRSLDTWFQVSLALVMSNDAVEASERVLRTLMGGLDFRAGGVWELDAEGRLGLTACWTDDSLDRARFAEASRSAAFEGSRGALRRCLSLGQTLWIPDVEREPDFPRAGLIGELGLRAASLTPVHGDNRIVGVLELLDGGAREPDEARARVISGAADQLGQFLARHRAVSRVRSSEARFRAVVESIDEGLLLCDTAGRIVQVNPAATRLLAPEGGALVGTLLHQYVETAQAGAMDPQAGLPLHECEARRADGGAFPASVLVHPITTDEGRLLVAHVRDLSARKEVDRLKREFVSTVSHELRTPLTSIRVSLGLLAMGSAGELPPDAARIVSIAERSTERLVSLINDIIDLERAEGRHLKLKIAPVKARTVIERAIEAVSPLAANERMTLLAAAIDDEVAGDVERLIQVVVNLLSNAVKFAPRGTSITVGAEREASWIRFSVSDEGPGIPEHARQMIFEPFRQIEGSDSRRKGGSGLGLSICKAIVEQHGGSIGVTSSRTGGAVFQFTIPAVDAS